MPAFHAALAIFLLLNLAGGLIRILRGPSRGDRMLAAQLFGTTGVATLLVLAEATSQSALRDVALVFSILAAVNAVVFVRTTTPQATTLTDTTPTPAAIPPESPRIP